jgi:hypothetical protein
MNLESPQLPPSTSPGNKSFFRDPAWQPKTNFMPNFIFVFVSQSILFLGYILCLLIIHLVTHVLSAVFP